MKYHWMTKVFGINTPTFGTVGHETHRNRRNSVAPFFSKAAVYQLEPMVQAVIDKLVIRLEGLRDSGNVINLVDVFAALTMDIIVQYTFAKPYGFVDSPDFAHQWHQGMMDICEAFHLFKQFAWLEPTVQMILPKIVQRMSPQMGAIGSIETVSQNIGR